MYEQNLSRRERARLRAQSEDCDDAVNRLENAAETGAISDEELSAALKAINIADGASASQGPTVLPRRAPPADPTRNAPVSQALDVPDSTSIIGSYTPTLQCFANDRTGRERAHAFGMWIHANLLGNRRADAWCADHGVPVDIRAAHSTSENVKGGNLVPQQFSAEIIRLVETYGVVRQSAQVYPMSSDSAHVPQRDSGLSAAYVAEGRASANQTPSIRT